MFQQPSGCWIGQVTLKMNQVETVEMQNKKKSLKLSASVQQQVATTEKKTYCVVILSLLERKQSRIRDQDNCAEDKTLEVHLRR